MSIPEFIERNFRPPSDTPERLPKPRMWNDCAADPMADVKRGLDDMAAHGYGETAMRLAERLGVVSGEGKR